MRTPAACTGRTATRASRACIFFRLLVTLIIICPALATAEPARVSTVIDVALGFDSGRVRVTGLAASVLPTPVALPVYLGRFKLTAIGDDTTTARFDFPMLALPEAHEAGTQSSARVRVALPQNLRELRIRDVHSGRTVVVSLRWLAALWSPR